MWLDKNIPSLEGKTYIVTGANSGIGYYTMLNLAYRKARIIMACRNKEKALKAKESVLREIDDATIEIMEYDQASFTSIDEFSSLVKNIKIDGIVFNAGVYYPKKDYKTKDGYELTIGTNYLGLYRLNMNLKDYFKENDTRLVFVSSLVSRNAKKVSLKDACLLKRNSLYAYSKCAVARLGYELSSELNINIVHPGVASTNIISSEQTGFPNWFGVIGHRILTLFTHSARKGSLPSCLALTTKENRKYIVPRGLFHISGYPKCMKYSRHMKEPIIEETKTEEIDMIRGLENGADDYLKKPFSVMELISRVKALLRRTATSSQETICFNEIEINNVRHSLSVNGVDVTLTYKEHELIKFLIINKGKINYKEILKQEYEKVIQKYNLNKNSNLFSNLFI